MESAFRTFIRSLLVLTVVALFAGLVWAQGTGEITGLVTDPTGAVISGATIELSNTATGEKRTTVTSAGGAYRFPELPIVGTYTLHAAPKGFKSVKVEGIVVSVGAIFTKDLKLELGQTTEQVTVEAGAETVQTTDSSVSQLVDRNIWQKMPLEVRNQNSFIELVAGAAPQDNTGNNRGAAVNGTREGAGSYLVEGADNNEQGQAGRGQISNYDKGGAATSISPDAIQEYRVITNSYSAEYGKGGGFVTDTVLKGGTNQWHGSVFEYNRIQNLAANDWWSSHTIDPDTGKPEQDHLVRNQFGGSIGGPIVKDKTFFYGTGELHRVRQTIPVTTTGTTQQFLDYVNSGGLAAWAESSDPIFQTATSPGWCFAFVGGACPGVFTHPGASTATLGPVFNAVRAHSPYPVATNPNTFNYVAAGFWTSGMTYYDTNGNPVPVYGTVTVADPESQNEERFSIKIDHRFSDKDSLNGVVLFQQAYFTDKFAGGGNTIGPKYIQDGRGQNFVISWNHTFSPTILNTFKVGYLRHRTNFPADPTALGTPFYYTIDGMGVDLGYSSALPQFFTDNQFQYLDSLSFVKGKHNFKVGGEYRRTRNGSSFFNDKNSTVLPWGVEDTVTDLAFSDSAGGYLGANYGGALRMSAAVDPTTGTSPDFYRGYRANEVAFFMQDDWRVNNRLTVNVGMRWEYFGPPHNFKPNIDSNLYFGTPVTPIPTQLDSGKCGNTGEPKCSTNPFFPSNNPFYAEVATASFQVRNASIWNKDTNNFSPRIGFAYDMFGNQKLVLRAGFGIMFDRIYNNTFENIRFNPPFFSDNLIGIISNGVPVGPISTPGLLSYPFTSLSDFNNPRFSPLPNPRHMNQNMVTPYYEQAHLGFQWEFLKGYVFEPEYVGTLGHKLTGFRDINTYDGRTETLVAGLTCPPGLVCSKGQRPSATFSADNYRSNDYSSNYHALQMSVRKNYSVGLGFNVNYTYAKSMDTVSDLFNNRGTAAASGRPTDGQNIRYDYGPSDFDVKHRVVATVSYDLPLLKNNRWLGGWGVNSIISYQTGHPVNLIDSSGSYDLNKDGYFSDRLVTVGGVSPNSTRTNNVPGNGFFDPAKWGLNADGTLNLFTCPLSVNSGAWCNAPIGRNSMTGPKFASVDFNLSKKFKITESAAFTFQANFFNLFNHPNFNNPVGDINDATNFGISTSTLQDNGGHRVTQLALRFDF